MVRRAKDKLGLTLIEMTLVIATIALMVGFGVPAVRSLIHSFQTESGTRSLIDAALSSARAMAVKGQRYAGIRFQKLCTSSDPSNPLQGLVDAPQYLIFIVHDPASKSPGTGLANGFRAVEGMEPIRLPDTVGVMDLRSGVTSMGSTHDDLLLNDATTFSIVFSPSGKLVVHDVRVRNHDGVYQPDNSAGSAKSSNDDVFNSVNNICRLKVGMFIQDDYSAHDSPELELKQESSATQFAMYETATFRTLYQSRGSGGTGLTSYLNTLATDKTTYVNVYTGHLVSSH